MRTQAGENALTSSLANKLALVTGSTQGLRETVVRISDSAGASGLSPCRRDVCFASAQPGLRIAFDQINVGIADAPLTGAA